jgi:hypothetical protein
MGGMCSRNSSKMEYLACCERADNRKLAEYCYLWAFLIRRSIVNFNEHNMTLMEKPSIYKSTKSLISFLGKTHGRHSQKKSSMK